MKKTTKDPPPSLPSFPPGYEHNITKMTNNANVDVPSLPNFPNDNKTAN